MGLKQDRSEPPCPADALTPKRSPLAFAPHGNPPGFRVDDDIETVLQAIVERRSVAIAASRLMKSGSSSSSVSQKFSMVST